MNLEIALDRVLTRHAEISAKLNDPGVDSQNIVRMSKELSELDPGGSARSKACAICRTGVTEAAALRDDPGADAEMRAFADEEYRTLKDKLPEAERAVQIMLLPKDEADAAQCDP